ncbi:MAG: ATP-dependent helicase, partial [Cyanobacteria bacterium P01_H01_bin.121]
HNELNHEGILAKLRPGQRQMAAWTGGELAVAAVPGSGKSTGMASAAAIAIARQGLQTRRQLIVVTFTRSAVANLKVKIREQLQLLGLPPLGFTVQTLHGLALQIARRHPDLAQLNLDHQTLVAVKQQHRFLKAAIQQWIAVAPQLYQQLLAGQSFDGEETERLRRQSVLRTDVLPAVAEVVIREAKSSGLSPAELEHLSAAQQHAIPVGQVDYPTLQIAAGLYSQYQKQLERHHSIDYHDLILAALRVLQYPEARRYWQQSVYAVFEDEAQDSSPLQSRLLETLAYEPSSQATHLVRVGDANQAINTTFTPADPIFFEQFCQRCAQHQHLVQMDLAGRSTEIIMAAANLMLSWVNQWAQARFPKRVGQYLPFTPQTIQPVATTDPQPDANPAPEGLGLELHTPIDILETLKRLKVRVSELWQRYPQAQAAILVRENRQGAFVASHLQELVAQGIRIFDVGQQERHTHVPLEVQALLRFLYRPHSPDYLKQALKVLVDRRLIPPQDLDRLVIAPEQFLYPRVATAAAFAVQPGQTQQTQTQQAQNQQKARRFCQQLLQAPRELPLTDLLAFLGFSLRYDQQELATAEKLNNRLFAGASHNSLADVLQTLSELINTEQFEAVDPDASESRYTQPGQLTIMTMHKAKGLDWDFVFVPFLQESTIPGELWVRPQTKFLGDFNLAAVTRAQIRHYLHSTQHHLEDAKNAPPPILNLGEAWEQATYLKLAEEYRLLYVAMTRAKRLLWLSAAQQAPFTWSKPTNLTARRPCPVITALQQQWPQCIC